MIKDKRKKKKAAKRKSRKTSRRRNPETLGIGKTIPLKGRGKDRYHLAFTVGNEVIFKTDKTYPKKEATAVIPYFQRGLIEAIREEDKRKNPKPRKHDMVSALLEDNFEEAIATTQTLPPNNEEAFHLGFVAGLNHGLRYNALIDFFEKRRVRKRIKSAIDAGLEGLSEAVIKRRTGATPPLRTQKVTK